MAATKNDNKSNKSITTRLFDNKIFTLVVSLLIAVMFWCGVSMFQTKEATVTVEGVKVQLNYEGSIPESKNLKLFGQTDYTVDVTVTGKSYLVNDASIKEHIVAGVSLASVTTPGNCALPVNVKITDYTDMQIVEVSKQNITLMFDEVTTKEFPLTEEINEGKNYSLKEGYIRENPRLSTESVTLKGPSLELNKITEVKAVIKLDKQLTQTEAFEAQIVPIGATQEISFDNTVVEGDEPIYITIPITCNTEFKTKVNFTNAPKAYKESGVPYIISPDTATVSASDEQLISSGEISVGTIDFSQINNTVNYIKLPVDEKAFKLKNGGDTITVTIDMSSMAKRWMEVPVSLDGVNLPEKAKLVSKTVASVQICGPEATVMNIGSDEAYAVPVLEGVELKPGINTVPAKIVLRTLTDSWVHNTYTVEIMLEE